MTFGFGTPDHPANPKTHEESARYFLRKGNDDLRRAAQREGDRREVMLRCARGSYALACENAEEAAYCRGDRLGFDFCLLPGAEPYAVGGVLAPYGSTNMRPGYVPPVEVITPLRIATLPASLKSVDELNAWLQQQAREWGLAS